MTTFLLKLNCELHLGGAEPRPAQASQWENICLTFPNPSRIAGGEGQAVKNGDVLLVWAHEDPGFGSGLGLTAEGTANDVRNDGGTTIATLTNVTLLKPHYKLRGWPGGSSGSSVIDHILSHRHLRSYELEDVELAEFRRIIDVFAAKKKAQLATTQYMSEEEKALEFDRAAVLDGFERRFTRQEARPDQAKFRAALMQLYKGRCTVSKCGVEEVLQAAHVIPFSEAVAFRNDPRNGLLLRADLHALFDKFLFSIHPKTREVVLASKLQNTSYGQFEGRKIDHFAAKEFLIEHYEFFKAARQSLTTADASQPKHSEAAV
ncbi:HNH endonuclease [Rhizobium leguminosarum bv. viciae]|jgi:hypothetical protein|uniref:HNH endonuclease n=1 Tax=Rhizobium TaxID=379 RepID=UPI00103007D5|nr:MULTISPECIES: HNH endonuclease [Rhizobium]NEH83047.1 hypothetical protein [Rhizobium ruizarguesonis]TAY13752.1 HNH endonuclease [Rhizobium leguminosarum]TBY62808.1 HNH endonuclease [Rhizobium leguminosarum bv. viciae]